MKRLLTFGLVGIANSLIDVVLFTVLHTTGLSVLLSNIASTSVALCFSFVMNRRFTFPTDHVTPRRIAFYFGITLSGLWILAPLVIKGLMTLDDMVNYAGPIVSLVGHDEIVRTVLPKLGSIAVTLVWNYLWYSRVVFAETGNKKDRA